MNAHKRKVQARMRGIGGLLILLSAAAGNIYGGYKVWLPDIEACQNTEIRLPVYTQSIELSDSVVAYECRFVYDSTCLTFLGIEYDQSMTEAWGMPFIHPEPGSCHAAGFSSNQSGYQLMDTTNTWFFLSFRVESDTTRSTDIQFTQFRFYSLSGEMPVDSLGAGHVRIVVNYPPVISSFPGINLLEDDSTQIPLADYITDANDSWPELSVEFSPNPYLVFHLDSTGMLFLKPKPDWSGKTIVSFLVTDPSGATAQGNLNIRVLPVSDPPALFRLISPAHDTTWIANAAGMPLPFHWEISENRDSGDQIQYRFFFSQDSLFQSQQTIYIPGLESPQVTLNYSLDPGVYYWSVMASDRDGLIQWCQSDFRLVIAGSSGIPITAVPRKFELEQNFPNPFNQTTYFKFHLDLEGETRFEIVNARGRSIRILLNRRLNAGDYQLAWDGRDHNNRPLPSGHYWAILKSSDRNRIIKLCYIK